MIIPKEDRLNFYYGNTEYQSIEPEMPKVVKHDICFASHQDYSALKKSYIRDVNRYLSLRKTKTSLWFQCGDCCYHQNFYPVFVKTRNPYVNTSNGVICNLNSWRHWGVVDEVLRVNIPWDVKKASPIWRGSTTGIKKKYNREHLVRDYFDKYDFGFNNITGKKNLHLGKYKKYPLSIIQMLEYKYVVVIEGNDKASGLNWAVASDSVPIMRKPLVHSWLCEPWLKPNVHYVEVNEDFSNLEEKITWCRENDELCQKIADNGKRFMFENFNKEREKEIETLLVHKVEEKLNNSC